VKRSNTARPVWLRRRSRHADLQQIALDVLGAQRRAYGRIRGVHELLDISDPHVWQAPPTRRRRRGGRAARVAAGPEDPTASGRVDRALEASVSGRRARHRPEREIATKPGATKVRPRSSPSIFSSRSLAEVTSSRC
jgi:hypothetical protein